MTKQEALLIKILSDHLSGHASIRPEEPDLATLTDLAKLHQVDGIIYKQCGSPPIPTLEKAYIASFYFYINRQKAIDEISSVFKAANIPFFTVKGLDIAQYYPIPALRTMVDCDIVVQPKDMQTAISLMQSIGFTGSNLTNVHEWGCYRGDLRFEIHDMLVKNGEHATQAQMDFFNNYMPYVSDEKLSWSYHYLFTLMHLQKHFMHSGVGIRQFMDIAVLIHNGPPLDWNWINDKLTSLGMINFSYACYSIIEYWFGISAPVQFKRLSSSFLEDVTAILMKNGVFGFANENNQKNNVRNEYNQSSGPLWLRKLVLWIHYIFPSYKAMYNYPGINYLYKKPWLLPIAWIHRFIILLKRKDKKQSIHTLKNSFISADDLNTWQKFLDTMGLNNSN